MTTDYYQAEQGGKILGISVLFFAQGLTWFGFDSPGGVFTLQPLNLDDAFFRAEIVIGAIVAACGILVWRSASRKLSLANYIVVLSCVAVLLLRAGNAAILLFTKSHQEMLHQRLKAEHIDVDGAIRQGTFNSLDFEDVFAKFMAGDSPDPIQYHENFRNLIDAAYKAATAEHPRVACCGEGTGYLCAEGKTAVALRFEQVCSSIAERQNVDMLCAFPSSCLHTEEDKDLLKSICGEHSVVHY